MIIHSVAFIHPVSVPMVSGSVNTVPFAQASDSLEIDVHEGGILMVAGVRVEWQPMSNVKSVRLVSDPRTKAAPKAAKGKAEAIA